MPRYLISFPEGAMTFPDEDLPDVAAASHAVVREARASVRPAVSIAFRVCPPAPSWRSGSPHPESQAPSW